MIESLFIENFKSIVRSEEIEIAPITLITGPNSSGKSSILKPLLLMKQTADSRDIQRSIQVDGSYVVLGPFRNFVFNNDDRKEVKFAISFSPDRYMPWRTLRKEPSQKQKIGMRHELMEISPDTIKLEVTLSVGAYDQTITKEAKYTFFDRQIGTVTVAKIRGLKGSYSGYFSLNSESIRFTPQRKSKFYDMIQSPRVSEYIPLSRSELGYNRTRLLSYLTRTFEVAISNMFYLGPLRDEPAPLYGASSERPQDVGKSGADAPSVLWVGRGERKQIELRKKVEKWMSRFEISKNIRLHKLGPFFQILLTDWHSGIRCNLTDVGFGASQLLPVIVAGYYAPESSLLILEQPEIHLHPRAQGHLGDLLIDISNEKRKLLVETHSEHLLTRIQRRIAEGKIDTGNVALYYCEPSRKGTMIKRINIDQYGQFEPELPSSFFDESYTESRALLEAVVKKKYGKKTRRK